MAAAHGDEPPLVVDPFAGGGSIPLEALRLGCEAFASDLNPVACLILKVMIEDVPRDGSMLPEDLRRVGAEIKRKAEKELADYYPTDPDGSVPISYLWARTVRCESPHCGAEIPLIRSFWLCNKSKRKKALRYQVVRSPGRPPEIEFEIFEPRTEKEFLLVRSRERRRNASLAELFFHPTGARRNFRTARRRGPVFDADGRRIGGARVWPL